MGYFYINSPIGFVKAILEKAAPISPQSCIIGVVMDEHAILSQYAKAGRAQAFDDLVRRYEPLVHAAALRQVSDPHLAQDIAQSTLVTLMHKAGKIRRSQPLGPWLLRVTYYLSIDALRNESTRKRHERLAARQRRERCDGFGISPWPSIDPLLDSALQALGTTDRNIIVLRYLQDWPIEQIAAELQATPQTTRQRLSRSLRRLRKILAQRNIRRQDLLPIFPLFIRFKNTLLRHWRLFPMRTLAATTAAVAITTSGLMLAHAALQKPTTPVINQQQTPHPTGRAQSTIP